VTTWSDLAAAALLGTGRRPFEAETLPGPLEQARTGTGTGGRGGDDAAALLDLAALAAVYRRAGARSAAAGPLPAAAAPGEPREVADAPSLQTVLARADTDLLELWLRTAAARGVRPPDRLLPALLDHATRQPRLATALLAASGPRTRWLAVHRSHWASAVQRASTREGDPPPLGEVPEDAWSAGTPPHRLAWLTDLRRRDPGAARDLLEAGWAAEAPAERAALVGVLGHGLDAADEPFLERCLADRRGEVRRVAAQLLARLPGSAFTGRAAARVLALVHLERSLLRRRLVVVDPPLDRDDEMARDQVPPAPKGGDAADGGPGAWYLRHLVAAAPPAVWVPAFGATPGDVVALDVAGGWGRVLWCGWAEAALRERDASWASALLARLPDGAERRYGEVPGLATDLLRLLPPDRRADLVARWLAEGRSLADEALPAVPAPWPDPLARAVVARLSGPLPPGQAPTLLAAAARHLSPGWAPALAAAGARLPEGLRRRYDEAADLVLFRSALLEEIQ
jgi:hypothetical protein